MRQAEKEEVERHERTIILKQETSKEEENITSARNFWELHGDGWSKQR